MLRVFNLALVSWLVAACAAVGYLPTNNPLLKISQAHNLIYEGRPQIAELFLQDAEEMLKEQPDPATEAEVNFAFGELYSSNTYREQRSVFEKNGTYDGTYARAITYYQRAIDLFGKQSSDVGVAKALYGLGGAQMLSGKKDASCESFHSALTIYNDGKSSGRITAEPVVYGSNYKTVGEFVMASICSNCMGLASVPLEDCYSQFE
jgi:tetratricopeptide (TPR) repeat protein